MAGKGKLGRVHKGDRVPTMVRVPADHHAHYTEQARAIGVPMADYVACRIALCEGLSIPWVYLAAHPTLLRMYHPGDWADVLAPVPADVAAKVRRRFRELAQATPKTPADRAALELLNAEMKISGVDFTRDHDPDMEGQLPMTG